MAESAPHLSKIVVRYRQELARLGIRISAVYVYGSYARGTQTDDSDIDLIVVSPDFAGLNMLERLELLGVAAARILEPVQAYGLTPDEIKQHTLSSFLAGILEREAVPVAS
ncbi:MAG: nucleotidyltransferase domain-containing protein [Dehalococcoidia bacterium]|nr:nucleotidyltransferase domain-containing protein [Dehalococcoidia bacterium]